MPENVEFATKLQLARKMLLRAIDAEVPARWVCADALYGTDHRLRQFIEVRGLNYVLAVSRDQTTWVGKSQHRVDAIIRRKDESAWQTLSAGKGSRGERLYQWALATFEHPKNPQLQRFVLARRQLENPTEITYYLVSAPIGTGLQEIVKVAGVRWTIESCFQSAKSEVGLDQYEVRSWSSWYRHITLSMFAHAFFTVLKASAVEVKKGELPAQNSLFEFKKRRGLYYL